MNYIEYLLGKQFPQSKLNLPKAQTGGCLPKYQTAGKTNKKDKVNQDDKKPIYSWNSPTAPTTNIVTPKEIGTSVTTDSKESIKYNENRKIREAQERKDRIAAANAMQKSGNQYNSTENYAIANSAIGDKLRFSAEPNIVDDYLNPFAMIGDMASGLATVPDNLKKGNYGQAALAVATPLATGALAGIGAKNTGQFVDNLVNPFAGLIKYKKINNSQINKNVSDNIINPSVELNKFNGSEIDWGKWNPDTPKYPELINEYNAIEESTKANGTWMKNSDGTPFEGSPEQFIQRQSSWFKKAFPEEYITVYRGVKNSTSNPELNPNKAMFTANYDLAKNYGSYTEEKILTPFDNYFNPNIENNHNSFTPKISSGVFELIHKKSPKSIEFDGFENSWMSVDLTNHKPSIEDINSRIAFQEEQLQREKDFLKTGVKKNDGKWYFSKGSVIADEYYKQYTKPTEKYINIYKDRLENINNLVKNEEGLKKMQDKLGSTTVTDKIAEYIEDENLDYIKIKNVNDGGIGDVTIVNHKPGNYLKSTVGNVGFFDMTNPNIFKSIASTGLTGAGLLKAMQSINKDEKKPQMSKGGILNKKSDWEIIE